MTDWTKDDTDDDKFWNWMDKDKENYNKEHPRKLKKQGKINKKIIVSGIIGLALAVIIFGIFSSDHEFGSEKYYYIPDYRLNKSPLFCAQEFSDPVFFGASDIMIEKTSAAIDGWEMKIEQYTETDGVWNFEYKVIPPDSKFADFGCDATIVFERLPPQGREIVRGETALSRYGFSDVVIFYLDPISKDKIAPNVDLVIAHEIGHVLGLGHPLFEGQNDGLPFYRDSNNMLFSRSIMVTPEIYPSLPSGMIYSITDYDVRAVVNLWWWYKQHSYIFWISELYCNCSSTFWNCFICQQKVKGRLKDS